MSVVKLLNIVSEIVSFINAIVLSRGLIGPYGHAVTFPKYQMKVFSHPERFPAALLREDQQHVAQK